MTEQSIKELSLALLEAKVKITKLEELLSESNEYAESLEEVLRLKELELKMVSKG